MYSLVSSWYRSLSSRSRFRKCCFSSGSISSPSVAMCVERPPKENPRWSCCILSQTLWRQGSTPGHPGHNCCVHSRAGHLTFQIFLSTEDEECSMRAVGHVGIWVWTLLGRFACLLLHLPARLNPGTLFWPDDTSFLSMYCRFVWSRCFLHLQFISYF